jgi:hypothetical protein
VTIAQLENRADRLFGREADLTRLLQRTQHFGLTAIVGPPQIGKSWFADGVSRRTSQSRRATMLESARVAIRSARSNPSHEVHYLVTQMKINSNSGIGAEKIR